MNLLLHVFETDTSLQRSLISALEGDLGKINVSNRERYFISRSQWFHCFMDGRKHELAAFYWGCNYGVTCERQRFLVINVQCFSRMAENQSLRGSLILRRKSLFDRIGTMNLLDEIGSFEHLAKYSTRNSYENLNFVHICSKSTPTEYTSALLSLFSF